MDNKLAETLQYLRLRNLSNRWDEYMTLARRKRMSVERLLKQVLDDEYAAKRDNARLLRRQRFMRSLAHFMLDVGAAQWLLASMPIQYEMPT